MKATGIVRRIDDLGRVVIPKEVRRTLRIRERDPLEIFVDRGGEVILKKYSSIGERGRLIEEYAESLARTVGHIVLITDRDVVVAASGAVAQDLLRRPIGASVERAIEEHADLLWRGEVAEPKRLSVVEGEAKPFSSVVVAPIISQGDPIGAVVIGSMDPHVRLGDLELTLAKTASGFLGRESET